MSVSEELESRLDQLVERIASSSRDQVSWSELYSELWPFAFVVARQCSDSPTDAEDIVQEAFFRLANHWPKKIAFESAAALRSYLAKILRNLAIDLRRRRASRPVTDGVPVDDLALSFDDAIATQEAIDSLNDEERELLALYLSGMTQQQMADFLGIARQTINRRFRELLLKLEE